MLKPCDLSHLGDAGKDSCSPCRTSSEELTTVPGVTTRTISRLTSPFDEARVFHLLGDGDPISFSDKLIDICFAGVEGNARHRDLVPFGQGQVELLEMRIASS